MPEFDPVAFGFRLREELERAGLDVKAFQAKVVERGGAMVGTSYGSIWSFVKGHAPREPRVEVIEAMAHVLGVLPSYLMIGGPRTTEAKAAADLEMKAET